MYNISFLGLGVMGYPMARHLISPTNKVTVYNRTTSKAQQWITENPVGLLAHTPKQAAHNSDFVFVCVSRDEDVREVLLGPEGAIHGLKPGAIVVDHSTTSSSLAIEIASKLNEAGVSFLDAPISGGQSGAENGCLAVMVGGNQEALDLVQPILFDSYAKTVTHMGSVGNGQVTKMCNQICITGILSGLSEAIRFAQKSGLDIEQLAEAIGGGAAGSWQLTNRGTTMAEDKFDFGFAIDLMIKDLEIAMQHSKDIAFPLVESKAVLEKYRKLSRDGYGGLDTSALIKSIQK